jgi:hypothetical protein
MKEIERKVSLKQLSLHSYLLHISFCDTSSPTIHTSNLKITKTTGLKDDFTRPFFTLAVDFLTGPQLELEQWQVLKNLRV